MIVRGPWRAENAGLERLDGEIGVGGAGMSYFRPVRAKVLAALDGKRAAELQVWSRQHANLFDLRLHSIRTCPFLAYPPAYLMLRKDTKKWAQWLHGFYGAKHREARWWGCKCTCDQELSQP
jgi:hypothetical protein